MMRFIQALIRQHDPEQAALLEDIQHDKELRKKKQQEIKEKIAEIEKTALEMEAGSELMRRLRKELK